jgi:hypothetical protein
LVIRQLDTKSKQMREEKNEIICNYRKNPGHVKSNFFKLIKNKQVKDNGNSTRNCVVGKVTDIALSSIESEKAVDH